MVRRCISPGSPVAVVSCGSRDMFCVTHLELWDVFSNVITVAVPFLAKSNRTIAPIELSKECRTRQPLPIPNVAGCFMINEKLLEDLCSTFPGDVSSTTGQEAGDRMAGQMVDPAFLPKLSHDGVDPGEARGAVRPTFEPRILFLVVDLVFARD